MTVIYLTCSNCGSGGRPEDFVLCRLCSKPICLACRWVPNLDSGIICLDSTNCLKALKHNLPIQKVEIPPMARYALRAQYHVIGGSIVLETAWIWPDAAEPWVKGVAIAILLGAFWWVYQQRQQAKLAAFEELIEQKAPR